MIFTTNESERHHEQELLKKEKETALVEVHGMDCEHSQIYVVQGLLELWILLLFFCILVEIILVIAAQIQTTSIIVVTYIFSLILVVLIIAFSLFTVGYSTNTFDITKYLLDYAVSLNGTNIKHIKQTTVLTCLGIPLNGLLTA
uniref:Uncharacterized protein n=1 Tax=Heterorhabditis bacteriophora TaxID=37862 RepID=A0A1I7WU26_HETBA